MEYQETFKAAGAPGPGKAKTHNHTNKNTHIHQLLVKLISLTDLIYPTVLRSEY